MFAQAVIQQRIKQKPPGSWAFAVSVHITGGRDAATGPSAPAVSSAKAVPPAAARGAVSAASYLVFPLLSSLGCASSLPCQNQVLHKNALALLPSLNHLAGFKNRGRDSENESHFGLFSVPFGLSLSTHPSHNIYRLNASRQG